MCTCCLSLPVCSYCLYTHKGERESFLRSRGHADAVHGVAWQPGGSGLLLTASADRTAALWDARSGQCCLRLPAGGAALASAAFSPQARMRQRNASAIADSCLHHTC